MVDKYDYLFKIILLGDSSVGKTSILLRFSDNTYNPDFHNTIGVDFRVSLLKYQNKDIKLQLWDTAGQERFRNIVSSYYRVAHAAFFVFDLTSISSFENISMWIGESENFLQDSIPKFLIGNKLDLVESRKISYERANALAQKLDMEYLEVSAKTADNVNRLFEEVTRMLVERNLKPPSPKHARRSSAKKNDTCCWS
jgi:Ras-related protein Rab-1A